MSGCHKDLPACAFCPTFEAGIFSGLSGPDLELLEKCKSSKQYRRRQFLFQSGEPAAGLYCLQSGKVKLYKADAAGKQQIIKIAGPGDVLGPASLFADSSHTATAEALEDSNVCFLDKPGFLSILGSHSSVAMKLIGQLSRDLKKSEELALDLAYKSVRARFAEYLLTLKERFGVSEGEDCRLDIPLSREDLAQAVGTTLETVVRLLSEFRSDGLIRLEKKQIVIVESEKISAFTHSGY